jgi:prevent-host-death family protein
MAFGRKSVRTSPSFVLSERIQMRYNAGYARTHLSRLLREVEAGEEVIVMRRGKPIVRIIPAPKQETPSDEAQPSLKSSNSAE